MVGSWLPIQVFQSIEYKESFVVAAYISGPKWSSKKSTSYRRVAQWQKSCGQALQEPLPSCHWFAISVSWRLVTLFLSLPFQLQQAKTLERFCTQLSDTRYHPSIKVYLAIRSLHIMEVPPDHLVGYLRLQRVVTISSKL